MKAKLEFLPRLEALRGLAAVSVVAYHAHGMTAGTAVTGMAPVVLFFVLSGFVLARSLENDPGLAAFLRSRIFRLLPAAAATVLLLTALHWRFGFFVGYEASFDPLNVVLNALMVRNDINGVMWSMTVECFAAPLIFACFMLHKAFGRLPLLALCVVLFALSFYGPYIHLLGGFTDLAPLYAFVVGVLWHFMILQRREPRHAVAWAFIFIALMLFCAFRKQTAIGISLECIGSGSLIFLIVTWKASRIFAALDHAVIRFFGRISYSFYLLHMIGLSIAVRIVPPSSFLLFAAAVACTAPMAWLSWRMIEMPFIRWGRSRRQRWIGSTPAPQRARP